MPRQLAAVDLAVQAARVDDGADVADAEIVDERDLAGLDVDLDFREADDERVGVAVARVVVLGDAHQAEAGQRGRRRLGDRVDVLGHLVAVELAAELDRAAAPPARRSARGRDCRGDRRARCRARSRRAMPPRSLAAISCSFRFASIAPAWFARVIACVVWLPTERQVQGRPLLVSPQMTSTFSHGMSRTSAATRAQVDHRMRAEVADAGLHVQLAVGPDRHQAVEADRPGAVRADGDADAAHLRCRCRCPRAPCARPSLKSSAPRSSASFTNALVTWRPLAVRAAAGRRAPCPPAR